ncbi:uncharacterized protein LOC135145513 [Zophobas morio]|uniref:uncharacterized protein LOC135145513 n=1 Tax=Zophobas morio TaxID=2755281 RepID=UPI003082FDDE
MDYHDTMKLKPIAPTLIELKGNYPHFKLFITGHSLGGALATICAADLFLNHSITFDHFITFGQPRVGNSNFAAWWEEIFRDKDVLRVTHAKDLVPHLPYALFKYQHFGPELWQRNESLDSLLECSSGEDKNCSEQEHPTLREGIVDHLNYFGMDLGNVCEV